MRFRTAVTLCLSVTAVSVLAWVWGGGPRRQPMSSIAVRGSKPPAARPAARPTPASVTRDLFAFEEEAQVRPARPVVEDRRPAAQPSPLPGLRLVGIVRRGESVKAAVMVDGELGIGGVGEEIQGYRVLAIDDELGVRLEGPGGGVLTLGQSSF